MTKCIWLILTLPIQNNKIYISKFTFWSPCSMRVMRSVRRQSARSRYKILAGRQHVTSTASPHPSHVRCHCPATWRHSLTNYPWHVWGATIWTLYSISGDTQVVICGRLAGVWLASVNEAVFGVIIFLLSSYYLIIILLSGVMASIHHTSSTIATIARDRPARAD